MAGTRIRIEIVAVSGERELCEIEVTQGMPITMTARSAQFGELSFSDSNLFAALAAYRQVLEQEGYLLLCNGARKDAYPSNMALQMGGGRKIYLLHPGR